MVAVFAFIVSNTLFNGQYWLRILLAVLAVLIAVVLIVDLCLYRNELRFQGIMLKYASRFLSENPSNFVYLLFFLLLMVGLFALFLFQHICFSNIRRVNNNFFDFANPGVLGILNILELLWGLQFLRDACNFAATQSCSSCRATQPTGTGTRPTSSTPPSTDSSATTGAALLRGPS